MRKLQPPSKHLQHLHNMSEDYKLMHFTGNEFESNLKYGIEWEDYVWDILPDLYPLYKFEHVSEILGEDKFRLGKHKYPDFRLTHKRSKHRMYVDAKRKRGYICKDTKDMFVTSDKSYLDSYNAIVASDLKRGWDCEALLFFWCDRENQTAWTTTVPDKWINFGANGFGKDPAGQFYLTQGRRVVEVEQGGKDRIGVKMYE